TTARPSAGTPGTPITASTRPSPTAATTPARARTSGRRTSSRSRRTARARRTDRRSTAQRSSTEGRDRWDGRSSAAHAGLRPAPGDDAPAVRDLDALPRLLRTDAATGTEGLLRWPRRHRQRVRNLDRGGGQGGGEASVGSRGESQRRRRGWLVARWGRGDRG